MISGKDLVIVTRIMLYTYCDVEHVVFKTLVAPKPRLDCALTTTNRSTENMSDFANLGKCIVAGKGPKVG